MRGIPLLEILFMLVLFGFAAVPLAELTSTQKPVSPEETPSTTSKEQFSECFITAKFAHEPLSVTVGGTPLEAPHFEADLHISSSSNGLAVLITWPADTPETAATFIVEPDARPASEHTFWSFPGVPTLKTAIPTP